MENNEKDYDMLLHRVEALEKTVQILNQEIMKNRQQDMEFKQILENSYPEKMNNIKTGLAKKQQVYSHQTDVQPVNNQQAYRKVKAEKVKAENVEAKIGKTVMSVLASILIFISIVLFAKLVYNQLSDVVKVVVMYLVSIGFTVFGLKMMKPNNKYRTLFTAVAGCGLGAFYISGIISYFYFHIFHIVTLMILIAAWTIGVAYLSKIKSIVFAYICYAGILISTGLCIAEWKDSLIAIGCFMVGTLVLYAFQFTKDYRKDAFYFIQYPIVLSLLSFLYDRDLVVNLCFLIFTIGIYTGQNYLYKGTIQQSAKAHIASLIGTLVSVICYSIQVYGATTGYMTVNMVYISVMLVLGVWSYIVYKDDNKLLRWVPYYMAVVTVPFLPYGALYEEIISYIPFIALYLALGIVLQSFPTRVIAAGFTVIYIMYQPSELPVETACVLLSGIIAAYGIWVFYKKANTHVADKYLVLAITVFSLLLMAGHTNENYQVAAYILAVCMSCFVNTKFFRYMKADETVARITGYVVNLFVILIGFMNITVMDKPDLPRLLLYDAFALMAVLINTRQLLEHAKKKFLAGIYICIKCTAYVYTILNSVEATGIMVSIIGILVAVFSIFIGFKIYQKAFRIYGLALSLICAAKLILIDISYDSNLYRPIGFFAAGILCFGISWIYTRLERQIEKQDSMGNKNSEQK